MNTKTSPVRRDKEIRRASYVSVIVTASTAFGCCSFIVYQSLSRTTLHEEASLLNAKYHCYESNITEQDCDDCINRYGIYRCASPSKLSQLPADCVSWDSAVKEEVHKAYDREWRGELENINPEKYSNYLANAVEQCYSPNRFIVHWFALEEAGYGMKHDRWQVIKKYERHEAVYTVSPGFPDSYKDGAVVIPDNGLYWVYGKVTVACTRADKQQKRIPLEIRTREMDREEDQTILTDFKSAKCSLIGDLVTLYTNGLFRFEKGNEVYMRIKLPINVQLVDYDTIYKTNFGIGWMGLS